MPNVEEPGPPFVSPDASVVLDVRLGGSSRPMHFPLLCTIREIIAIIRQVHPATIERGCGLYVTRSGIWLKSKEFLYSYHLDNLVCRFFSLHFVAHWGCAF